MTNHGLIPAMLVALAMAFASAASGQTVLTQSTDNITITALNSVTCNAGGIHVENSFWRAYDLSASLPNTDFRAEAVRVAFETTANAPVTVQFRLWTSSAGFPTALANLTQVGSTQTVTEPAAAFWSNTIQVFPLTAPVNFTQNTTFIVEFNLVDGTPTSASCFPGSNAGGQSAPTYLTAAGCGVTTPTDTAAIGFPNMHLILDVVGNGPEMDVQRPAGAANSIASGGTHGLGNVSTAGQNFTFTIENSGRDDLELPNPSVLVSSGTGTPTVSVVTQPAVTVNPPGGTSTTTFVVSVTPISTSAFDFTVTINSGTGPTTGLDFNENPYTFTVTGTGTAGGDPEIDLSESGLGSLSDGQTVTGLTFATGVQETGDFTITNQGATNVLNVTAVNVAATGVGNCTVSVTGITLPANVAAGGGVQTFTVLITATADGAVEFTLTILNNDADEGTYEVIFQGTAATVPVPEMDVLFNGVTPIANGGTETVNNTGTASFVRSYTIANTGTATLTLTPSPDLVNVLVTGCTVVVSATPSATVAGPGSTTFDLTITPSASGTYSFVVTIVNDDSNENPYTWTFNGNTSGGGGGGGGGGGSGGGGGCATETTSNTGWLALIGLLALVAVSVRARAVR